MLIPRVLTGPAVAAAAGGREGGWAFLNSFKAHFQREKAQILHEVWVNYVG